MIRTTSQPAHFRTVFRSSLSEGIADAPIAKGGSGQGFGPHELLEAALATCINMAVRMRARELGIAVDNVATTVSLDRSQENVTAFDYATEIQGTLTAHERAALFEAADTCPVRQTLARRLLFRAAIADSA